MANVISNCEEDLRLFGRVVNTNLYPIDSVGSHSFQQCIEKLRLELRDSGKALLPNFLNKEAVDSIMDDVKRIMNSENVFRSENEHNIYLQDDDDDDQYELTHPRKIPQKSAKFCITYDQIPKSCALSKLFNSECMTEFIRYIVGKDELYRTADPLGALNIHVYNQQDRLGWHFDRGEFAVLLLIHNSEQGGEFQYVPGLRLQGDDVIGKKLSANGQDVDESQPPTLTVPLEPGTLMLFCGHNSLHRVTPVLGKSPRILSVLSYESKPNVHLNEYTRLKFCGRMKSHQQMLNHYNDMKAFDCTFSEFAPPENFETSC